MKTVKKSLMVPIEKIRKNLFVRESLDHNWAAQIAQFILDGIECVAEGRKPEHEVGPIIVTPAHEVLASGNIRYLPDQDYYEMVDGRHRLEARFDLGEKEVEVRVLEFDTKAEMIGEAYRLNIGGSKPASQQDVTHTVRGFMEIGLSVPKIAAEMRMATKHARMIVNDVKLQMDRAQRVQIFNDFAAKIPVSKIAEKHGVPEDQVHEMLVGKARRTNKRQKEVGDLERVLSSKYRGISNANTALAKKLFQKLEDTDMSLKDVMVVFGRLRKLYTRGLRNIDDWEARAKALVNGATKEKGSEAA